MSGSANAGTTAERHQMRAEDLDREVRALTSAPGHVCFSLTEDLHGCRNSRDPSICPALPECCVRSVRLVPRRLQSGLSGRLLAEVSRGVGSRFYTFFIGLAKNDMRQRLWPFCGQNSRKLPLLATNS